MNEIGGFFELELSRGEEYHCDAIRLNTGANCLEYILKARNYRKIYLPNFTCVTVIDPCSRSGIEVEFYPVDKNLDPLLDLKIAEDEAVLYTNYFGIKDNQYFQWTLRIWICPINKLKPAI